MVPDQTPQDLIDKFSLEVAPEASIFVIKETTVDFKGIKWLARFLRHNAGTHRVQVVWTLRAYRHTYLSFVQSAREWWGYKDMEPGVEGYNRWVERGRGATGLLLDVYQKFPGALYSYEALTENPEETIKRLMSSLDLEYSDQQLEHSSHLIPEQVRGDISMTTNPRPISSDSVTKREAEWAQHQQELAGASGDALRQVLDKFWLQVNEQQVISGTVPKNMIPGAVKMNASTRSGHEYRESFSCREDWQEFVRGNRAVVDGRRIEVCADAIARKGIKFRGQTVKPSWLVKASGDYRERFVYQGVNSRKRALLVEMFRDMQSRKINTEEARVYAPEALGGFAAFLAAEFPLFRGSEYLPDPKQQRKLVPVEHQDLAALTYPDDAFDYVLVNDIFEHVPDLSAVLGQIQRVLAPGGVLLSTFPFAFKRQEHLVKATQDASGHIEYHMEPEYHEDPVDDQGVLVFQLPGWDILKDSRSQGFVAADMVFLCSPSRGVLASNISGVMMLKATNPD
jgi:hypothetical protein